MRVLRATLAAFLAVGAIAVGGSALAYFSSSGTGSAQAAVTKLTAPTISSATPGGGSVTLTWGAVTPPGAGAVSYYVSRDGGQPSGNCPTAAAPTTATTCTDGAPTGEHTYTVTAVWETWTAVSAVKTAKVTSGEATKFTISASTTTPAVNGSVNLTITARDEGGSVVTSYAGSKSLIFSGAAASPSGIKPTVVNSSGTAINFGSATAINFTAGVATVSSSRNGLMKLYRSGPTEVSAEEGSITTPAPLLVTVSPGTATKFVLAAVTTTPTAGAGNDLTITAQDTYGNTATAYTGAKSLIFSTAAASPAGNVPTVTNSSGVDVAFGSATTIAFGAGVASAAEGDGGTVELYKSVSTSLKAADGTTVTTPNALVVTVAAAAAAKFVLTSSTATPSATSTSNLTTTAQDTYGNTATSYAGSKSITFSGASASPSGSLPTIVNAAGTAISFGSATALTFTNGVAAVGSAKNGLMRLPKAGVTSISATDGTLLTPTPLTVTVAAGTAARLGLTSLTASPGAIGSPCIFTCAITGLGNAGTVKANVSVTDSNGNTVSNLGSGHTVNVTANGGTITGGTGLAIASTGAATSTAQFTYTAPLSGSFTNTITAAKAAGTGYTSATATASK